MVLAHYERMIEPNIFKSIVKNAPLASQIKIGQDVMIAKGSLAGSILEVLTSLGSMRRVSISKKNIIF